MPETDVSGSTLVSYILDDHGIISQSRSGTTSYFLQDGQGSSRALTNASGTVTDTYSYTAFGELFNQTSSTANSYLYTGQQFDSLTGLYELRARYYDPALGRFLSQDTYPVNFNNPVELNRYGYAANDPINLIDPSGRLAAENTWLGISSLMKRAALAAVFVGVAIVVLKAVNALMPTTWPKPWEKEKEKVPPAYVPPIESLDNINMREQWRQYCQFQANCQSKDQSKGQPTVIPPPPPQATPTETNYSIALGHYNPLVAFTTRHNNVIPYWDWQKNNISVGHAVDQSVIFVEFVKVAQKAQKIYFIINGVHTSIPRQGYTDIDWATYNRDAALQNGSINTEPVTDWELATLQRHPEWYPKIEIIFICGYYTQPYFNGPDKSLGTGAEFFSGSNKTGDGAIICAEG